MGDNTTPIRSNLQPANPGNIASVGGSSSPAPGSVFTSDLLQLQQMRNQRMQQRQQVISAALSVARGAGKSLQLY
jgi:hypothetical protein